MRLQLQSFEVAAKECFVGGAGLKVRPYQCTDVQSVGVLIEKVHSANKSKFGHVDLIDIDMFASAESTEAHALAETRKRGNETQNLQAHTETRHKHLAHFSLFSFPQPMEAFGPSNLLASAMQDTERGHSAQKAFYLKWCTQARLRELVSFASCIQRTNEN